MKTFTRSSIAAAAFGLTLGITGAAEPAQPSDKMTLPLLQELANYQRAEKTVSDNLKTFDHLDYQVFTHQEWEHLHESHSKNVIVHWPDGHTTTGIERHIADLKEMFVYAPDTRIEQHPVRFGSGQWTGVVGVMEGTFTQPMPIGGGKTIPPTGKPYKITMATIGHWNSDGVMDEEYLFWDNLTFMKQIGLAQ